ncbi:hypothetical protein [Paenibacillus spongiae]|uniref:SMI1/KNR4 family protein n=1 Tax=Paenibacillus spongiae TaxID=2909671 RepID=A0ABY5S2E0_9BACL|nr:hypothetical protein [Paenibacillus spongiae]UVI28042.1 hypothetical protein L1F29_21615 [Paenibacillus spongiae]
MGTKFGNLHIRTSNIDDVITALTELAADRKSISRESSKTVQELDGFEALLQQAQMSRHLFYLNVRNGWVSVLNDWFSWGEVEEFGEALSSYVSDPILTCSCFDEDILEINVYRNGESLTGHTWYSGSLEEDYGMEMKEADISVLTELLGHDHFASIQHALNTEGIEQAVAMFEAITGVQLWLSSDWFDDIGEEIQSKYTTIDLN